MRGRTAALIACLLLSLPFAATDEPELWSYRTSFLVVLGVALLGVVAANLVPSSRPAKRYAVAG